MKQELRLAGLHARAKSSVCGMYELRLEFGRTLERLTSQACGDRVSDLQLKVGEVQSLMTQNIQRITERGESIDDLQGKAELLAHNSTDFKRTASRLRKKLLWRSVRLWVILIAIIAIVLVVIVVVVVIGLFATNKIST